MTSSQTTAARAARAARATAALPGHPFPLGATPGPVPGPVAVPPVERRVHDQAPGHVRRRVQGARRAGVGAVLAEHLRPEASDLQWFTPAGTPMDGGDWADPNARTLAIYLNGSDDPDRAEDGTPLLDDDFLVLVNAWWQPLDFVLPVTRPQAAWRTEIDTYDPAASGSSAAAPRAAGDHVTAGPRSIVVLSDAPRGTADRGPGQRRQPRHGPERS